MTMKQATSSCPHSYPCRLSNTYGRSQRRIHERTVLLDSTWPKKSLRRVKESWNWLKTVGWWARQDDGAITLGSHTAMTWSQTRLTFRPVSQVVMVLQNSHFLKPTSTALGKMKRVVYPWVTYRVLWIWLAASYNPSPCKHTQLNSPRYP